MKSKVRNSKKNTLGILNNKSQRKFGVFFKKNTRKKKLFKKNKLIGGLKEMTGTYSDTNLFLKHFFNKNRGFNPSNIETIFSKPNKKRVLWVIDMQNDFVDRQYIPEGEIESVLTGPFGMGSFAVTHGESVIKDIVTLLKTHYDDFDKIIFSRDFHKETHRSFVTFTNPDKSTGKFPPHCVQGESGCLLVDEINEFILENKEDFGKKIFIAYKGMYDDVESFSAFPYGDREAFDTAQEKAGIKTPYINGILEKTGSFTLKTDIRLEQQLALGFKIDGTDKYESVENLIKSDTVEPDTEMYVVGLAGDFCVRDTANQLKKIYGAQKKNIGVLLDYTRNAFLPGSVPPFFELEQVKSTVEKKLPHYAFRATENNQFTPVQRDELELLNITGAPPRDTTTYSEWNNKNVPVKFHNGTALSPEEIEKLEAKYITLNNNNIKTPQYWHFITDTREIIEEYNKNDVNLYTGLVAGKDYRSEHMLMSIKSPQEQFTHKNIKLGSSNNFIEMTPRKVVRQSYTNIDDLGIQQYDQLVEQLFTSIQGKQDDQLAQQSTQGTIQGKQDCQLAQQHFATKEGNTFIPFDGDVKEEFKETYGTDIYFFMDPLLNDIDDCIAFLYFFHLTLETFKGSQDVINIYLDLTDVEDINKGRFPICKLVAEKLLEYCNDIKSKRGAHNIKVSLKEEKFRYDNLTFGRAKEELKSTIFLIRGMSYKSLDSLKELKKKYKNIDIIANGADTFSHETASCPSNIRCGSKIHDGSDRRKIFDHYLYFIEFIEELNKTEDGCRVHFKCFPLARKDRPFTFKVGQNGIIDETNAVSVTTNASGTSLVANLKKIREVLNKSPVGPIKFVELVELYKSGKGKDFETFNSKTLPKLQKTNLQFGDIIFPNVSHAIIDPGHCEAYSNYGSFLIDWLAIMSFPENSSDPQTRDLIRFLETDQSDILSITHAQNQQNQRIRFDFKDIVDHDEVLKGLLEHSKMVERECFQPVDGKYKSETEKKFPIYLSKTPATLIQQEQGLKFETKNPGKPTAVDKIHPRNAILSRVAKTSFAKKPVQKTISLKEEEKIKQAQDGNDVDKQIKFELPENQLIVDEMKTPSLGIMSDAALLFLDKSAGPNGILLLGNGYSGGEKYGENRMNTIFRTERETYNLVKGFLDFRDSHKQDVFNIWLKALKKVTTGKSEYNKTLLELFNFYQWCDQTDKNLFDGDNQCLDLMSTCQTWMRVLPTTFFGDNSNKYKMVEKEITVDEPVIKLSNPLMSYIAVSKNEENIWTIRQVDNQQTEEIKREGIRQYNFRAHNTVPIPHFQTFPYVSGEEKFLNLYKDFREYKGTLDVKLEASADEFKNGFIKVINFFTRSMLGDYGTTYPVKVSTVSDLIIGSSSPDKDYNGNGFLILDTFKEYLEIFEEEYQNHKRSCCEGQQHVYNGVNYRDLASCSVPDKDGVKIDWAHCQQVGKGRKRTNKRIRKNKKLSLRKMKGGSKKANQKKLKLKKSRKA